ncbi:MAG: hypothetical protein RMI30_00490 [Thermodesulfovibrio sp.]|nr:hypothetical protein [Thermodesulfovibrio sp.]MDW7997920.1 hypothetical protein [Thermodesulfovibrio sp.]
MEYIKGDSVKMWYESIINLAKNLGINITRPYRCDSHDKKRFMEMEVIPLRNGDILINHYIIKVEEVRDHINHPFLFGNIKGKETILRCSICNRFHYNNSWIEIEEAIKYYKFTNITISDIICNDCIKRELLEDKI